MAFKMKGAPTHYGTKAHKSALKHIITDKRKTEGHDRHNKRHADNPDYEHGKSTEKFNNAAPTKQSDDFGPEKGQKVTEQKVKKEDGKKRKRMMKKELEPILRTQEEEPRGDLKSTRKKQKVETNMKKVAIKMNEEGKKVAVKKPKAKHWNEKLTKLTNKRKKLKTKQDEREDEGKGTKIIDFRVKRNQKRINKEYKKVGN